MNEDPDQDEVSQGVLPQPEFVVGLSPRFAEFYRHADDDLRHAVHAHSKQGCPGRSWLRT